MIHNNSLISFIEEKDKIITRQEEIIKYLKKYKKSTAREIMIGLDYTELNQVRPRLTELKQLNVIEEVGSVKCLWTGKTVSLYDLK